MITKAKDKGLFIAEFRRIVLALARQSMHTRAFQSVPWFHHVVPPLNQVVPTAANFWLERDLLLLAFAAQTPRYVERYVCVAVGKKEAHAHARIFLLRSKKRRSRTHAHPFFLPAPHTQRPLVCRGPQIPSKVRRDRISKFAPFIWQPGLWRTTSSVHSLFFRFSDILNKEYSWCSEYVGPLRFFKIRSWVAKDKKS